MKKPEKQINYRFQIENDGLALGLATAEAEDAAKKATRHLKAWQTAHKNATTTDIREYLYKELRKIQPKLADFYHNRDKII